MSELTKPTIHLNGTKAEDLRQLYLDAYHAVEAAIDAVRKANPNGRDYYPVGPQALTSAIEQQSARLQKLNGISAELMELCQHCDKFAKD